MNKGDIVSMMRIAGIVPESFVDGKGIRYTVFMQGCPHHCKGCHNPSTHAFNEGRLVDIDLMAKEVNENPLLTGITLSGGEPLCQIPECIEFINKTKKLKPSINVWLYSGYTFEEAKNLKMFNELLPLIDVMVDGKYIEELRDLTLDFRGSSNQRIINIMEMKLE